MKNSIVIALLLVATTVFASGGGGDITLKSKGGDVVFRHEVHVGGMGITCTQCHDKIYTNVKQHKKVTMKQMRSGKSCGTCHNGHKAFATKGNCSKCHKK